jgi:hypothetical protein
MATGDKEGRRTEMRDAVIWKEFYAEQNMGTASSSDHGIERKKCSHTEVD